MYLQPWTGKEAAKDWRERKGMNRLTETQVREIRASVESTEALASRYGIGVNAVWCVRRKRTYKWVE